MELVSDIVRVPPGLRSLAEKMVLPVEIIDYLRDDRIIQEHLRLAKKPKNIKRPLSIWEKYYVSSGIPLPETIDENVAIVSYSGILRTSVDLLANIQLYPSKLDALRQMTAESARNSTIVFGFSAGSNVTDAIIQPLTQMTLDSFKVSGTGENVAGGLALARAIIDMSSMSNLSTVIFFRKQLTIDDIILSERIKFNQYDMADLIVLHEIENFNDLEPKWWYEKFFGSDVFLSRQQFDNPRTLRLVLDYEIIVQYKLDVINIIRTIDAFAFDDIFSSPPIRWKDFMEHDEEKMQPDHYVIVIDIITPRREQIPLVNMGREKILQIPGNIIADELLIPKSTNTSWYLDKFPLPQVEKILRIYVLYGEDYKEMMEEELSEDPDVFKFSIREVFTDEDMAEIFGRENVENIKTLISYPPFIIADIYHRSDKNSNSIIKGIVEKYSSKEVVEESDELLDDIFLANKLFPKIRSLQLGGRNGITGLFPLFKTLDSFIVSSKRYKNQIWEVVFNKRLMKEYGLGPYTLLEKLKKNGLETESAPWENILGYTFYLKSEQNPAQLINELDRNEGVVFARSSGGNLEQILADPLINPYSSYANDVNIILEVLGIEAARKFIIRALINSLGPDDTLSIDYRHLLLFADLITRSGALSKTMRLGEYEPSSELEIASLKAPMDVFTGSIFQREQSMLDVGAHLMMGFIPKFGAVANPALIGHVEEKSSIVMDDEPNMAEVEGFMDLPDLPSLDDYQEPSRLLAQTVANDLSTRVELECPTLPILEETISTPEAIIVPAINFSTVKIPRRLGR